MCTGLELGLILAGGVGNMIQANQQQKQQDAMVEASNSRLNQFLDRNKTRQTEAEALFADRQSAAEPEAAAAERAAALQDREAATTEAIDAASPSAAVPLKDSAAGVIGGIYSDSDDKAKTDAKATATARNTASSFGDSLFSQGLATADAGRRIGTINSLAGADAAMLPHYQDLAVSAAAARKRPSGIGALLAGLGQAGGYYAGAKF